MSAPNPVKADPRPTAAELVAGFAAGTTDPVAATEAALAAIEQFDPLVHAMVLVDAGAALASAAESADRWRRGEQLSPVDGVPTTIKDILLTRGWPTLRGSRLIDADGDWPDDAPAVARMRAAGLVFLGKNATPEFAWKGVTDSLRFGATGNPWGPGLTAGGSSGGAAAAVGLGMGPWSVGTDGGGSVRIPAAFTHTVALKPTYGQIPLYPASPYGTLAHAGPMTRTVLDAALLMDVLAQPDPRDYTALAPPPRSYTEGLDDGVRGLRIAVSATLGLDVENHPDITAALAAAAGVFEASGAVLEWVDPPLDDMTDAFHLLWFTGAAKVIEGYGPGAIERIDPELRAAIETYGLAATASDYLDAVAVRAEQGRRMGLFHERHDLLLTPTMPVLPFELGRSAPDGPGLWTSWTPYTHPFNMTTQPALSLPAGLSRDGRPIGVQVVGARHADALVLRAGQAFQAATDWHTRLPPLLDRQGER